MTEPRSVAPDGWEVPQVPALRRLEPPRPGWQATLLHPRRLLTAALLLPLTTWAARTSLPPSFDPSVGWWVALAVVALLAAATLATYVPLPRGEERRAGSPCATSAWVLVVLAGLALGITSDSVVSVLPAALLAGLALRQRLAGAATCGPTAR